MDSLVGLLIFTLTKIYNEKKQAQQVKIQNVHNEKKRCTRKQNGAKSYVQGYAEFKEELDVKWIKGTSDIRARPHSRKLPTCEKKKEAQ